jgi:hypothetical protein
MEKFAGWLSRYTSFICGAILVGGIFAMMAYDAFFH